MTYFCFLFFSIWLPMVLASFQSSNPAHSWKTTIAYLHFLPFGCYVILSCSRPKVWRITNSAVIFVCASLVLDALAQFFLGHNFLGYPLQGESVTGMFYPKQRLALFLAVFAPLCLHFLLQRKFNVLLFVALIIPYLFVIFVSLKRSSWLMLFVGLIIFGLVYCKGSAKKFLITMSFGIFIVFVVAGTLYFNNSSFNKQVRHSVGLASGEIEIIDKASNHRLALWNVGLKIFEDNPLLGVGPRGYRYNYEKYARPENFWIRNFNSGQTHPHLMSLEILVETGLLGLLLYLLVLTFLLKMLFFSRSGGYAKFWLTGALLAWMPFNTHLAFYGSYWSSFVWLLLAVGLTGFKKS